MKYIVITSKHHDGFAMFDSDAHDFNIMDATPFGRDPLQELAEACKKHDIKLGFYHSQAQDWTHPGGTYRGIEQNEPHWDPDLKRVPLMQYIREKAYPQVRELLTKYGDIAVMWWDTPIGMTAEAADTLHNTLALQPGIIENNRLYRPWPGDFSTPEQHIPPTGLDYDWEVCMTMNTSWGYKWYDDNWKSTETLIRNLVDIASKGGNYLLNVGPTAEGLIPEPSVERLRTIGAWMQTNGASIYGTEASPFFKLFWGRCTRKQTGDGSTLYLHVFHWPDNARLVVPGLRNTVDEVYLMSDKSHLAHAKSGDELHIEVPQAAPDPVNTVIVVKVQGDPDVVSNMPAQNDGGIVHLPARMGFVHNRGYGEHAHLSDLGPDGYLTNWVEPQARIEWMFEMNKAGEYSIELEYRSQAASALTAQIGDSTLSIDLPLAGSQEFRGLDAGTIHITQTGAATLVLKPETEDWNPVDLKSVKVKPVEM
jgi:alpha-L-fucosidase